jgi:hypothetical protein
MPRIRFSIASLLVVVIVLAVAFAALREASDIWSSGIVTLTVGALLTSILLAVHRAASARAFWFGFALFGCTYLVLSFVPAIESRLITTKGLTYLDSKVPGRSPAVFSIRLSVSGGTSAKSQIQAIAFSPSGNQVAGSGSGVVRLWNATTGKLLQGWGGTTENFVNIGHSFIALLVGWLGGLLSRRLSRVSGQPEALTTIIAPA